MSVKRGYWSGMPRSLKAWFLGAVFYFSIASVVFLQEPIIGIALLVLPAFWCLARTYLLAETELEQAETLSGYTVEYILFRASTVTRVVTGSALVVAVLLGLGWVSTEELRLEAAKPTLSERVTSAAGEAVDVTKETTRGWSTFTKETTRQWISTAKGWFGSDEDQTVEAE